MNISYNKVRSLIDQRMLADGMEPIIDLEKSYGSWLVDGASGREYLDLFSMYASMSVGYNHPYVLDNANRLELASINMKPFFFIILFKNLASCILGCQFRINLKI